MINEEIVQDICQGYYDCMLKTAFGFNHYKFTKLMEQLFMKYEKRGVSRNDFFKIVNDVVSNNGIVSKITMSLEL